MKNTLWIIFFILVGVVVLFAFGRTEVTNFKVGEIGAEDNIKGLKPNGTSTPSVVIIEYSDFQCPACRSYYPIARQIIEEYGDKITFAYRHFPLISIHANAEFAARAAEAAGKQGKFWEMHDMLFEKQNEWSGEADIEKMFISYAELIGINTEQFKKDWVSQEIKTKVKNARLGAVKAGLNSIPTFFIDGEKIKNPNSLDDFKLLINKALEKKNKI